MAEGPDLPSVPQATVVPGRRARISVVWIIPILAAVVAIGIAVQRILSEGPTITIVFKAAEGLEAGKTSVKSADVCTTSGIDFPNSPTGCGPLTGASTVLRPSLT